MLNAKEEKHTGSWRRMGGACACKCKGLRAARKAFLRRCLLRNYQVKQRNKTGSHTRKEGTTSTKTLRLEGTQKEICYSHFTDERLKPQTE